MKCLTLWQPWASLMAIGEKTIETRSAACWWAINHRGPLLIHAAKNWNKQVHEAIEDAWGNRRDHGDWAEIAKALSLNCYETLDDLCCGSILCTVNVFGCGPILPADNKSGWKIQLDKITSMDVEPRDLPFGDFRQGRLGIVTSNVTRFHQPIPYRGQQGLFDVPVVECDGCDGTGLMEGWNQRDGFSCPKCYGDAILFPEAKK